MDLAFQVPMQYCFYSIGFYFHHQTHPQLNIVSALAQPLHFGAIGNSPPLFSVAYWTPSNLGGSSFSVRSFYLFIQFIEFSCLVYWSGLPFPPPVNHVLSELSTMTPLSWMALHSMTHNFIELHKPFAMTRQWSMKGIFLRHSFPCEWMSYLCSYLLPGFPFFFSYLRIYSLQEALSDSLTQFCLRAPQTSCTFFHRSHHSCNFVFI